MIIKLPWWQYYLNGDVTSKIITLLKYRYYFGDNDGDITSLMMIFYFWDDQRYHYDGDITSSETQLRPWWRYFTFETTNDITMMIYYFHHDGDIFIFKTIKDITIIIYYSVGDILLQWWRYFTLLMTLVHGWYITAPMKMRWYITSLMVIYSFDYNNVIILVTTIMTLLQRQSYYSNEDVLP